MKGLLSDIQRFSTRDGPGIRTTVFLKGCPLRCPWCHNRETWEQRPSLLYYEKDCVLCGACAAACPAGAQRVDGKRHRFDRALCLRCGACAESCPTGALEMRGEWIEASALVERLLRDRDYYEESGGGVTFSGGEALLQLGFVKECLALLRAEKVHTCLDTSGWGGRAAELCGLVDLYLWDVKHTDAALHERLTGVPLPPILQSLREVDARGGSTRLRCPIIPTVNDTQAHIEGIAHIANNLRHVQAVDLIPYHDLGLPKASALGEEAPRFAYLTEEKRGELLGRLKALTAVPCGWL